jgi:hypothetical protein
MTNNMNSSIFFSNSSEKVLLTNVYVCGLVIYVQRRVMYVPCECPTQCIYYEQFTSQPMLVTLPSFTKITLLHYRCEYPSTTHVTQLLSQTYMMQSKEHWVQIKSNIIMFLHCIERRCHLYNPQDGGRKTQKMQNQESWCTWQWKNATGFSGKKFSELDYF